jgi:hypothetical protein
VEKSYFGTQVKKNQENVVLIKVEILNKINAKSGWPQ